MGTRGAIGFIIDGQEKVTYNHFDSYPSELGVSVLEFIGATPLDRMINRARGIVLVDEGSTPTREQIALLEPYTDLQVSNQSTSDWYCLLRMAQGDLSAYLKAGVMVDNHEFLADSLFCEWAYLVNLDTAKLEVYRGFNKKPEGAGRYAAKHEPGAEYYGVVLIEELEIEQIQSALQSAAGRSSKMGPKEFIAAITSGWERIANDQREAEALTEKVKAKPKKRAKAKA